MTTLAATVTIITISTSIIVMFILIVISLSHDEIKTLVRCQQDRVT
jgi:hypothetical protein